jgi:uncharacterized membrane protein YdjX (TVP38/TMEM64 family)
MDYKSIAKKDISDSVLRGTLIIAFLLLVIIVSKFFKVGPDELRQMLAAKSPFVVAVSFVFLYVAITFFIWLSKDIFRFIAAVIFGPILSTLLVFLAETINAVILFSLSRYLGKAFVDVLLKSSSRRGLRRHISQGGLWTLFALRAVPLIPFRFLDLICGLTQMRMSQYLMIVVLASPVRIFWVQYILSGVGEAAFRNPGLLIDYLRANQLAFVWSLVYLILAIALAFKLKRRI